jgi:tetratricopeptide (TPR) repeat protein
MATGWNFIWGESWKEYISRTSLTRDLSTAQRDSAKAMVGAISSQTASILSQVSAREAEFAASHERDLAVVGEKLDQGFNALGGQLQVLTGEMKSLNGTFQWGFGQMIAQMDGMNDSLASLIQIAKTPVQTWAYNQFEIARENFRKGLYDNCLKRLDKAINGDNTSAGYEEEWRFHQMLGVVRLGFYGCDLDLVDPEKAEKAFLSAGRYAAMDHPEEAAKAYLSAGWSAFVQGKLGEAIKHTERATSLDPSLAEGFFQISKFLMAEGTPNAAFPPLRRAITLSPDHLLKASADGDFLRHSSALRDFLTTLQTEIQNDLVLRISDLIQTASEWMDSLPEPKKCDSIFARWQRIRQGNYGVLDLLNYSTRRFVAQISETLSDEDALIQAIILLSNGHRAWALKNIRHALPNVGLVDAVRRYEAGLAQLEASRHRGMGTGNSHVGFSEFEGDINFIRDCCGIAKWDAAVAAEKAADVQQKEQEAHRRREALALEVEEHGHQILQEIQHARTSLELARGYANGSTLISFSMELKEAWKNRRIELERVESGLSTSSLELIELAFTEGIVHLATKAVVRGVSTFPGGDGKLSVDRSVCAHHDLFFFHEYSRYFQPRFVVANEGRKVIARLRQLGYVATIEGKVNGHSDGDAEWCTETVDVWLVCSKSSAPVVPEMSVVSAAELAQSMMEMEVRSERAKAGYCTECGRGTSWWRRLVQSNSMCTECRESALRGRRSFVKPRDYD